MTSPPTSLLEPDRAPPRHRSLRLPLSLGIMIAGLTTGGPAPAASAPVSLAEWRDAVHRTRLLAESDAPRAFEQAQQLQASPPPGVLPADRIRALNVVTRTEVYLALTSQADEHAKRAVELALQNADRAGEAEAQLNLCLITVNEGRIDALKAATQRAVTLVEGLDRPDLTGEALLRAAMMYQRNGQIEEAVTTSLRAMEIARRVRDPFALTFACRSLGLSYVENDRYDLALQQFTEMREHARATGSKMLEGEALLGIARCHRALGEHDQAEPMIRQAIALFREAGAPFSLCSGLFALAEDYRALGRYDQAQRLLDETVALYEAHPNKIGLWYTVSARGANELSLGDKTAARADAERAYALAREIDFPRYLSDSAKEMATIAAAEGDYAHAYDFSRVASEMSTKAARDKASALIVDLVQRFETESEERALTELRRHNEEQAAALRQHVLERRWLWTIQGGCLAALGGVIYFLLRLRHSHRLLQAANDRLHRSEIDLQHQTSILQSVLDSMGDGVVVADCDGKFLLTNPAAEKIIGRTVEGGNYARRQESVEIYLADKTTPCPKSEYPLAKAMRGESSDGVELFMRTQALPEGRWLSVTARPLRDSPDGPRGGVAVFSDITARKRIDDEIRALNATLEQRVRERTMELEVANRELESFSYSVSHDLRAPLRSMDGFSRILLEDYSDKLDAEGIENLRTIRAASQRMGSLINDMLKLAKVTRTELYRTDVDLSALAAIVATGLREEFPRQQVDFVIEHGMTARADANLMRVVLENLLGNAWKFTTKQSHARVEFGRTRQPEGTVYFVRDNGVGFEPEFGHKLFIAFQRLHTTEEFPGTGVGLATVQRIIHRHHGRVWAESVPGRGATFYFTLSS